MQCIAFDSHKHYTWALVRGPVALVGYEPPGIVPAEPQVPLRARRARSDSRHVTRTTYCCVDSE